MSKDPAFLFYSKDFYEGTRLMLPEERACFIDLLIYQHQNGPIPLDTKRMLMYCSGVNEATLQATLQAKFKQTDKGWVNLKMVEVTDDRSSYKGKQSDNGVLGQFFKKAKSSCKAAEYKALRSYVYEDYGKENLISELKKEQTTHEGLLQALLKHLANEDANENVNKGESIYKDVIDFLNTKTGSKYKHNTDSTQRYIKARINEGFTIDDFKTVISKKTDDWKSDPKMSPYLRPETLFGTKFEGYLNEGGSTSGTSSSLNPIKLHPDGTVRDRQGNIVTL